MMNKILSLAIFASFAFFMGCADDSDSPIEVIEDALEDDVKDAIYQSELEDKNYCFEYYNTTCCNKCYREYGRYVCDYCTNPLKYSSSSNSNWNYSSSITKYSSSYYSSSSSYESTYSSSSNKTSVYTTAPVTASITLTHYRQLKSMDEKNTTDGDPRITFVVKSFTDNYIKDSIKTSTISLGNDIGTWNGTKTVSTTLAKGINEIYVCVLFVDEDAFFDDSEYSSNWCYGIKDVGQKIGQVIEQTDYYSAYYTMDWEVKLKY